jgi:hypothetical protein
MSAIHNSYHGNLDGGAEFAGMPHEEDANVSSIEVWTHVADGEFEVLKALRVTWSDGGDQLWGNPDGDATASANFRDDEKITRMVINAGGWVDSIYFESTEQPDGTRLGGPGGDEHEQNTGNGVFKGFWGRSGDAIDALGSIFQQDD